MALRCVRMEASICWLTRAGCTASAAQRRFITGKANRVVDPKKPKPFPYKERKFTLFWQAIDKTTSRLDENSKLITVEGSHAIGKSKFAQDLAQELDMIYVKHPCADDWYINLYGYDIRQLDHLMPDRVKSYDEKDFARNPLGPVPGSADRLLFMLFRQKYINHVMAIRHILNTGQGVVMEGSPFSDYAYMDAAYKQGWIAPDTRRFYKKALDFTLHNVLRPNLIIYLDAPVETVMKNIEKRGNEWDKNSPVWTNANYLSSIYNELKRNYLKKMQKHCRVLAYDWSVPGDTEIVVEDIENVNLDDVPIYDDQQADWRFDDEPKAAMIRASYTIHSVLSGRLNAMSNITDLDCDHLIYSAEEVSAFSDVVNHVESMRYQYGFNEKLGDSGLWRKFGDVFDGFSLLPLTNQTRSRPRYWFSEDVDGFDYEYIMSKRKDGSLQVNHNRTVLGY